MPQAWLTSCQPRLQTMSPCPPCCARPHLTGEQITADYATFCAGPDMAAFACDCGASCCRRRVTGGDYLQPWVGERYGQHVSPFVAAVRKRAGLA